MCCILGKCMERFMGLEVDEKVEGLFLAAGSFENEWNRCVNAKFEFSFFPPLKLNKCLI